MKRSSKFTAVQIKLKLSLALSSQTGAIAQSTNSHAVGDIVRLDPELERIIPSSAKLEKIAGGFGAIEGPACLRDLTASD
jgi:gluconolactonase